MTGKPRAVQAEKKLKIFLVLSALVYLAVFHLHGQTQMVTLTMIGMYLLYKIYIRR